MDAFEDEDLLPLSGLQHLQFCERQWGLIHIEQQWAENRLTSEGRVLHEKVHEAGWEGRPGVVIARGLYLRSRRLGVSGQADVVEFHQGSAGERDAVQIPGRAGWWRPFPVEYKRGRPKSDSSDEVQLCAQAICLEESLETTIECGALFYGTTRRRLDVAFGEDLRRRTEMLALRMHALYESRATPMAVYAKKCDRCSLYELCLPRSIGRRGTVKRYLSDAISPDGADV